MDYRAQTFRTKFDSAARHLGTKRDQVVSLKLRDTVGSYQEYRNLVDRLEREAGFRCSELRADLQGRGYLIGDGKTKVILVEHETGLEILYVAGSIASLIGLVPIVLQGWRALRGRLSGRHEMHMHGVEVRRMDKDGHLIEEHVHDRPVGPLMSEDIFAPTLALTASLIDSEMQRLNQRLQSLTSRVEVLEKHIPSSPGRVKKKTAMPTKNASRRR